MKDKKLFKKWWFWVIAVVVILGVIGSFGQTSDTPTDAVQTDNTKQHNANSESTLPQLTADDYKGKEGLIVYKDLKSKGYTVDASFEKQVLTDINGKASEVFDPLDPNKSDDRLSVDAFVVGNLTQDGDNVKLTIVQAQNN